MIINTNFIYIIKVLGDAQKFQHEEKDKLYKQFYARELMTTGFEPLERKLNEERVRSTRPEIVESETRQKSRKPNLADYAMIAIEGLVIDSVIIAAGYYSIWKPLVNSGP